MRNITKTIGDSKMKKKMMAFILAGAMLFGGMAFSGCDKDKKDDPDGKPSETTSESVSETESVTESQKATKTNSKLSTHDVKYYQIKKFTQPVWSGDISYAEAAFVRQNSKGVVEPIQLLYPIDEIVSVRNSMLDRVYKEGRDYRVTEDGKLEIIEGGKIPVLAFNDFFFELTTAEHEQNKLSTKFPAANRPGWGYIRAEQISSSNPGMSQWTLAVTYTHSGDSGIKAPEGKSDKFARVIEKINNGENIKIASLGDSITERWSTSKNAGMAPFCPSYTDIVTDYINLTYRIEAQNINLAVSGQTADWALNTKLDEEGNPTPVEKLCAQNADLIILAFGMNDGCGVPTEEYINNINAILSKIATACPDACVVVVGTMLPNPNVAWSPGGASLLQYHDDYVYALKEAEKSWTNAAFADVTTVHTHMLRRKAYQDTTGSNSNHPNDYMHRVYAQVVLQTIFGEIK